jgi:ATP-dependent RNA helicase TDRD9
MDQNVTEYTRRLKDEGIEAISGANVRQLTDSQKELVLRVAIFGAFYPNYFSRSMAFNPNQVERDAVNCLNGLDPYTTVRLAGFPPYQPAKAYMCQVKENLADIFGNL